MTQAEGEDIISNTLKQIGWQEFKIDFGKHAVNTQSGKITRDESKPFSYDGFIHEIVYFGDGSSYTSNDFNPTFLMDEDKEKLKQDIRNAINSLLDELTVRELISKEERQKIKSNSYWRYRLLNDPHIKHGVQVFHDGNTKQMEIKAFEEFARDKEFDTALATLYYPLPDNWAFINYELRKPFIDKEQLSEEHIWSYLVEKSLPNLYEAWKDRIKY